MASANTSEDQQMIQERQRKIDEIKLADREIADVEQVFTALTRRIGECRDVLKKVQEEMESTKKQAEDFIKKLEGEIEVLTARSSEVKQLSHTEDHLHLPQTFGSLTTREVEVRPPSYVEEMRRSMDQLEDSLNMEMKKRTVLTSALRKYGCELTLDPNTANKGLSLSKDKRKVTKGRMQKPIPKHPERFDSMCQVLCRESLTADRCYWEVEREGPAAIGVTYRVNTGRGEGDDSQLGWNNKSWRLDCNDQQYNAWYNGNRTVISLPPPCSNRVGVYVDRHAGTLSFYRVSPHGGSSDTLTHIHTFQLTSIKEHLVPGFRIWGGVGSSASLCRLEQ